MNLKRFEIDWDNYEQVSKLGNKIKCRLGELNPNRISKKQKVRLDLDAIDKIYNADTSHLYKHLSLNNNPQFYVYAHLDTSRKVAVGKDARTTFAATLGMKHFPFYIGKGTGGRCDKLERNEVYRKTRERADIFGNGVEVFIIKSSLTEAEALALESKLIDIFGLTSYSFGRKGYLSNLDEGIFAEERRLLYLREFNTINKRNDSQAI